MRRVLEGPNEMFEGGMWILESEFGESPLCNLACAAGPAPGPEGHMLVPCDVEGAPGLFVRDRASGFECGATEFFDPQSMSDLPIRFGEQGIPAVESDDSASAGREGFREGRSQARLDRYENIIDWAVATHDDVFVGGKFAYRFPVFAKAVEDGLPAGRFAFDVAGDQPESADFLRNAALDEEEVESMFESQCTYFEPLVRASEASIEDHRVARSQALVGLSQYFTVDLALEASWKGRAPMGLVNLLGAGVVEALVAHAIRLDAYGTEAFGEGAGDTALADCDEAADGDDAFRFAFEACTHDLKGTASARVHTVC